MSQTLPLILSLPIIVLSLMQVIKAGNHYIAAFEQLVTETQLARQIGMCGLGKSGRLNLAENQLSDCFLVPFERQFQSLYGQTPDRVCDTLQATGVDVSFYQQGDGSSMANWFYRVTFP